MKNIRPITLVRTYLAAAVLESVLALGMLLSIPGDPKNAWIFGLSKTRVLLALLLLFITAGFVWLLRKAWQEQDERAPLTEFLLKITRDYGFFFPAMLVLYSAAGFIPFYYLQANTTNLTTLQGYLTRLSPFVLLALMLAVQSFLVLVISRRLFRPEPPASGNKVFVSINRWMVRFISIVIFIILASVAVEVLSHYLYDAKLSGVGPKFDINREKNIPTYISSLNLAICALLLLLVAGIKSSQKDRTALTWGGLGMIFLFLSLDETAGMHEWSADLMDQVVAARGVFHFSWVALAIPLLVIFAVIYFRFWMDLPSYARWLFAFAALLYVGGALGLELFSGWYLENYKEDTFYLIITYVEDSLEMSGVLVFIFALLQYLRTEVKDIHLRFV